jgi:predicted nucleotidyltransferase
MRINPKEKLYGQPVLKIREVVRYAMQERLFRRTKALIIEEVSKILIQPKVISKQIIEKLIADEYLVLSKVKYVNFFQYELKETEKGRRFGIATADPAITRQKADALLNELIERAKAINANEDLVYIVERIKVFGSYLSNKDMLGDLDVAVKLTRKYEGNDFTKQNQQRISIALKNGRQFSNYINEIYWPHTEVMLMLKTKKKGLSLHDEDADEIIKKTGNQLVYEFIKPKIDNTNKKRRV